MSMFCTVMSHHPQARYPTYHHQTTTTDPEQAGAPSAAAKALESFTKGELDTLDYESTYSFLLYHSACTAFGNVISAAICLLIVNDTTYITGDLPTVCIAKAASLAFVLFFLPNFFGHIIPHSIEECLATFYRTVTLTCSSPIHTNYWHRFKIIRYAFYALLFDSLGIISAWEVAALLLWYMTESRGGIGEVVFMDTGLYSRTTLAVLFAAFSGLFVLLALGRVTFDGQNEFADKVWSKKSFTDKEVAQTIEREKRLQHDYKQNYVLAGFFAIAYFFLASYITQAIPLLGPIWALGMISDNRNGTGWMTLYIMIGIMIVFVLSTPIRWLDRNLRRRMTFKNIYG